MAVAKKTDVRQLYLRFFYDLFHDPVHDIETNTCVTSIFFYMKRFDKANYVSGRNSNAGSLNNPT